MGESYNIKCYSIETDNYILFYKQFSEARQ